MSATEESVEKISKAIDYTLRCLLIGHQRKVESESENTVIKGYWVGEMIRIDVATAAVKVQP